VEAGFCPVIFLLLSRSGGWLTRLVLGYLNPDLEDASLALLFVLLSFVGVLTSPPFFLAEFLKRTMAFGVEL